MTSPISFQDTLFFPSEELAIFSNKIWKTSYLNNAYKIWLGKNDISFQLQLFLKRKITSFSSSYGKGINLKGYYFENRTQGQVLGHMEYTVIYPCY